MTDELEKGGLFAVGVAAMKAFDLLYGKLRERKKDEVTVMRDLLTDCHDQHKEKDEKIEALNQRLDHCEEQHSETRIAYARLEERHLNLEERITRLESQSEPPPGE